MRRSYSNLKTFLNTRLWLDKVVNTSTSRFTNFETNFLADFGNLKAKYNFKRGFSFSRFLRYVYSSSVNEQRPDLNLRINNLVRFFKSNNLIRRQWWRINKKFKRFYLAKRFLKVFKTNLAWRYPYERSKLKVLNSRSRLVFLFNTRKQKAKYFFVPRPLFRRIRYFHFLNKGVWRKAESLLVLRVRFTLNNVFVVLGDLSGKNLLTVSSGVLGFKGTTKLTTYAIEKVAMHVIRFIKKKRLRNLYVIFNSGAVGYKSKLFLETFIYNALIIKYLTVSDSVPHNGVRPRKTKRR